MERSPTQLAAKSATPPPVNRLPVAPDSRARKNLPEAGLSVNEAGIGEATEIELPRQHFLPMESRCQRLSSAVGRRRLIEAAGSSVGICRIPDFYKDTGALAGRYIGSRGSGTRWEKRTYYQTPAVVTSSPPSPAIRGTVKADTTDAVASVPRFRRVCRR